MVPEDGPFVRCTLCGIEMSVRAAEAFERIPFLASLNSELQCELHAHANLKVLGPKEHVFSEGDPSNAYTFVVRGSVKLVKTSHSGRETILQVCTAGEMVCAGAVSVHTNYGCTCVSMEPQTEIMIIPKERIIGLLEPSGGAAPALVQAITLRGMHMCERVAELGAGQVGQRLAKLVLTLAQRAGIERDDGSIRIPIPLTRQDFAEMCGTSPETTIRVMSRWSKDGIIERVAHGLVLLRPQALEAICRQPARAPKSSV